MGNKKFHELSENLKEEMNHYAKSFVEAGRYRINLEKSEFLVTPDGRRMFIIEDNEVPYIRHVIDLSIKKGWMRNFSEDAENLYSMKAIEYRLPNLEAFLETKNIDSPALEDGSFCYKILLAGVNSLKNIWDSFTKD